MEVPLKICSVRLCHLFRKFSVRMGVFSPRAFTAMKVRIGVFIQHSTPIALSLMFISWENIIPHHHEL